MGVICHFFHVTSVAEGQSYAIRRALQVCVIVLPPAFSSARLSAFFPQSSSAATLTLEQPIITLTGCHLFCWVVAKCQKGESYLIWGCQSDRGRQRGERREWRAADSESGRVFWWWTMKDEPHRLSVWVLFLSASARQPKWKETDVELCAR